MAANITVNLHDDYLLINASGCIADLDEYKQFAIQCYDKILQFGNTKIIIDINKAKVPKSLLIQNDLLEFLSDRFPDDIRFWTIAIVTATSCLAIGKYWEYITNQNGYWRYKAFSSIEEAQNYIQDPDGLSNSAQLLTDLFNTSSKKVPDMKTIL